MSPNIMEPGIAIAEYERVAKARTGSTHRMLVVKG